MGEKGIPSLQELSHAFRSLSSPSETRDSKANKESRRMSKSLQTIVRPPLYVELMHVNDFERYSALNSNVASVEAQSPALVNEMNLHY